MDRTRVRRAAALLLAAALVLAATPAAASPERTTVEAQNAPGLVHALTVWLVTLWPGADPGGTTVAARAALRADIETTVDIHRGGDLDGGPTPDPQRGSDLDPDG